MPKIKDLSPDFKKLKPAMEELMTEYVAGAMPFGDSVGGLQAFSRVFKRGAGNKIFGSSDLGIWLGAADFGNAPFRVDMDGNLVASTATLGQYLHKTDTGQVLSGDYNLGTPASGSVKIDGANNRIVINDGTTDRIVIGNV